MVDTKRHDSIMEGVKLFKDRSDVVLSTKGGLYGSTDYFFHRWTEIRHGFEEYRGRCSPLDMITFKLARFESVFKALQYELYYTDRTSSIELKKNSLVDTIGDIYNYCLMIKPIGLQIQDLEIRLGSKDRWDRLPSNTGNKIDFMHDDLNEVYRRCSGNPTKLDVGKVIYPDMSLFISTKAMSYPEDIDSAVHFDALIYYLSAVFRTFVHRGGIKKFEFAKGYEI